MEPLFKTAKQNRIFQDVVNQIEEAILDGRLKEGERLPPERELKDMMGTSRSTLREALRILEYKGLIEVRLGMGGGCVVKSVSTEQMSASLDLLIRSQEVTLNHLAEFREQAEGAVVELAAERRTTRDIRELEKLLEEAGKCVERGDTAADEFIRTDQKLHLAVARMSRNPVYVSVLRTIHDNIGHYFERFLVMEQKEMRENYRDMQDIVRAVSQGKTQLAGRAARMHVRRFNTYMNRFKKPAQLEKSDEQTP
ncbi:MAG: FadR/GntR family transcriptional regulator [Thermodesulfobacteriota bacterium]